jgi:general secretion pathway protein H
MPLSCPTVRAGRRAAEAGFTLMELVLALSIAGIVAALAAPNVARMYDTMRYRDAVRGLQQAATAARYQAIATGAAVDLLISPEQRKYAVVPEGAGLDEGKSKRLSDSLDVEVEFARQLNRESGVAVLRFYPEGGSTGGSITVSHPSGASSRLNIDWLLGRAIRADAGTT